MRRSLSILALILALPSAPALAQSPFVIAGPDVSLSPGSHDFSFDGLYMVPLRAALENPANFGPTGIVSTRVETRAISDIASNLDSIDCFFSGRWNEGETSDADVELLVDWFLRGGNLILTQDFSLYDKIGSALGLPSDSGNSSRPAGIAPLFDGPFGAARSLQTLNFAPGTLDEQSVRRTGGHVAGATPGSEVFAATWNPGAFAPNAGFLVILGDLGVFSSLTAAYTPLNDNGRFALNLFALVAQQEPVYVLGGPDDSLTLNSGTWSWDGGSSLADYRHALENPANFGRDGIVPVRIMTQDIVDFSPHMLMGLHGFVHTYWQESQMPSGAANNLAGFFANGGDLLLMNDHPAWDGVGDRLGVPTIGPNLDMVMNGVAPFFSGSFGTAVDVTQHNLPAMFDEAKVDALGGTVAARNSAGEILASLWHESDYGFSYGNLALLSNTGIATDAVATYEPLNDNGIFSLNVVEFLITNRLRRITGPSFQLAGAGARTWDGIELSPMRTALQDPEFFSAHGPGGGRISIESTGQLDLLELLQYDAFVASSWQDTDLSAENEEILRQYFEYGGNLAVFSESAQDDRLAEMLGAATFTPTDGSPSQGGAPLAQGPFGNATQVLQSNGGWLKSGALDASNGTAALTNAVGDATAAIWRPGQHAPGTGTLIVIPDVDTLGTATATFAPLNDNGRFALNTFAFLLDARCAGEVQHYGDGCRGSGAISPTQRLEGCPETGSTVSLSFRNTVGGALGFLWLGYEGRADLSFKGCPFLVGGRPQLIPLPLGGSAGEPGSGGLTLTQTLPDDALLDGFTLNTQLYVLDAGAPEGLASTDGLEFTIRDR